MCKKLILCFIVLISMSAACSLWGQEDFLFGYLEESNYKVPFAHGHDKYGAMKGLGYIMGMHCPVELLTIYSKSWGMEALVFESEPPTDPLDPLSDMSKALWNDYTIAFLKIRDKAQDGLTAMGTVERNLLLSFCDGINKALEDIEDQNET
jgi:hypothetical protein